MQLQVAPSLLAADFLNLSKGIKIVNDYADILHLDVMDGTFVPNLSFGFPVIEAVSKECTVPMDVHLMIINPQRYFKKVAECGAAMCSFHYEAAMLGGHDTVEMLEMIKSLGMKAGLVINPDVPVERIFPYIKHADYVLIMSVYAGFGGQPFIPETLEKITKLRLEIIRQGLNCLIEVDGGVRPSNVAAIKEAGADIVVAGSAVFNSADPASAVAALRV